MCVNENLIVLYIQHLVYIIPRFHPKITCSGKIVPSSWLSPQNRSGLTWSCPVACQCTGDQGWELPDLEVKVEQLM